MLPYIVKRLLVAVPTLLAVLTVVFFFVRIAPGDPALIILGDQAGPQALAAVRHELGLDQPMAVQYVDFMSAVLKGDLGTSLVTHRSVWGEVANVLPYTIELTLSALVIGVVIGLPLGVAAARHRNEALDYAARLFSLAGLSFPAFVSAIMLLLAFAIELHWFPVIEGRPGDLEPRQRWCCRRSIWASSWWPTSCASRARACSACWARITSARRGRRACRRGS
jgi:ABC-type dipeptide/oligopeptide/nickel transport system permease component